MLRLLFPLVLALPSVLVSVLVETIVMMMARRSQTRAGSETRIEQSRDYVPSWAKPEE